MRLRRPNTVSVYDAAPGPRWQHHQQHLTTASDHSLFDGKPEVVAALLDGEPEVVALVDGARVLQESLVVLTERGLLVVAGDVVPGDAVLVDAVQQTQARLGGTVNGELCVIRLRLLQVTSLRPGLLRPSCGDEGLEVIQWPV